MPSRRKHVAPGESGSASILKSEGCPPPLMSQKFVQGLESPGTWIH